MRRARDLGIPFYGTPGPLNAITDVPGVHVGHTTLISGKGKLEVGKGPVRTGVTAVLPRGKKYDPVFAGWYTLNGNGEMTGTIWVEESGFLEGPVMLTNTHSVGIVRDGVVAWMRENALYDPIRWNVFWSLPVVAETYDGRLNDINGFHVTREHVFSTLDGASGGAVAEGNVGGGTGMTCHEFKAGIGTASRRITDEGGEFTVGVLVQANYGARETLTVSGVPVGREITDLRPVLGSECGCPGAGSIIAVVATDAPLLPHQLKRLARRGSPGDRPCRRDGGQQLGRYFHRIFDGEPGGCPAFGKCQNRDDSERPDDSFFRGNGLCDGGGDRKRTRGCGNHGRDKRQHGLCDPARSPEGGASQIQPPPRLRPFLSDRARRALISNVAVS